MRIELDAQTSIHEQAHMGKPKVKIKVNHREVDGGDVHKLKEIDAHSSSSSKTNIGGKPKVKIKQVVVYGWASPK